MDGLPCLQVLGISCTVKWSFQVCVPRGADLAVDDRLWYSEHDGLAHSPHIRSCVLAKLLQVVVKDLHGAFRVLKQQGDGFHVALD